MRPVIEVLVIAILVVVLAYFVGWTIALVALIAGLLLMVVTRRR